MWAAVQLLRVVPRWISKCLKVHVGDLKERVNPGDGLSPWDQTSSGSTQGGCVCVLVVMGWGVKAEGEKVWGRIKPS